jgi:N-acetylated-alpha-linked acidic dipeptidase
MRRALLMLVGLVAMVAAQAPPADVPDPSRQVRVPQPMDLVDLAVAEVRPEELRKVHALLAEEPHVAGTPGDERQIERIRKHFFDLGLMTRVEGFRCLLARPVAAELQIVDDAGQATAPAADGAASRRGVVALPVNERNLLEDPSTAHPDLTWGWNAYSGSGDVTAPVVYANYATREDFARLAALGVEVKGKIVLARYGRCFRGYKARFAEEAGAAGLVLYTDPADAGFTKGKVWPEGGGWANDNCIQRGTLNTLPYPGDPGTPGVFAADNVLRQDPATLDLPRIPVQPIGYAAAGAILSRFSGSEVPEGWAGGLSMPYRLESGPGWKLRLMVKQDRFMGASANILAVLPGVVRPEEMVVIGCHHDAWGFGAADPGAGTMCLLEAARCFADLARRSIRPARTIVFAAWGAEEFGIIGSTEWVEAHAEELLNGGVTYINLDMAAMGPNPSIALTPELAGLVGKAVERVPSAADPKRSVLSAIRGDSGGPPRFGALGGGSDHIGFVCRVGMPSVSLGAGGAPGTSYHSNYDTVAWYRATVGDDYASASMITREAVAIAALAAQSPLPGWRVQDLGRGLLAHLDALLQRCQDEDMRRRLETLRPAMEAMVIRGEAIDAAIAQGLELNRQDDARVRRGLRSLIRAWVDDAGLEGRPWFRSLIAASDRNDGYAPCMLPLLAEAVSDGDAERLDRAVERMTAAQDRAEQALRLVETGLRLPAR